MYPKNGNVYYVMLNTKTEGQANSLVFVFLYKYECSAGKREI